VIFLSSVLDILKSLSHRRAGRSGLTGTSSSQGPERASPVLEVFPAPSSLLCGGGLSLRPARPAKGIPTRRGVTVTLRLRGN
jgi:hypothetical protein